MSMRVPFPDDRFVRCHLVDITTQLLLAASAVCAEQPDETEHGNSPTTRSLSD